MPNLKTRQFLSSLLSIIVVLICQPAQADDNETCFDVVTTGGQQPYNPYCPPSTTQEHCSGTYTTLSIPYSRDCDPQSVGTFHGCTTEDVTGNIVITAKECIDNGNKTCTTQPGAGEICTQPCSMVTTGTTNTEYTYKDAHGTQGVCQGCFLPQ